MMIRARCFRSAAAALCVGASGALCGPGCAGTPPAPGPLYPAQVRQSRTLDVQVFRSAKHVEMTNTTATSYGVSRVWLNGRYSFPIDGFAAGQSLKLPLKGFVDEHGDVFRGGGFFATEIPERLVLAQLETLGESGDLVLLGFVVVKSEDE